MEIAKQLAASNTWVSALDTEINGLGETFSTLDEEKLVTYNNNNSIIIDEVNKRLKVEGKKVSKPLVIDKGSFLDYAVEQKSMEGLLEERLDILKEAINILDTTDKNKDKLAYLTNTKELNPHLVDIGYVSIVENDLKENLSMFAKTNKLKFFNISTRLTDSYDNNTISLLVSLNGFDNLISMYTSFKINENNIEYPQYLNTDMLKSESEESLAIIKNKFTNLTTEINAYKLFINDLESGMFERYTNKRRINKYNSLVNEDYKELVTHYVKLLELKQESYNMNAAMSKLYTNIKAIEKEQDLIFDYLGELLNKDFSKNKLTLS